MMDKNEIMRNHEMNISTRNFVAYYKSDLEC